MNDYSKVLVTGGSGLVGSELKKLLPNAIFLSSKDFNLTKESDVVDLFQQHQPDIVIHLAAKVGGIIDNMENQATYFDENVLMNTFMVKHAYLSNVKRFIGILSSCIYPNEMESYPIRNLSDMHLGPPPESNFSYGYAKRSLAVQIDAYNKQYGTDYNYLMPCNLYGECDSLDLQKSHFITALVCKIAEAHKLGKDHIDLMGDGTPIRQFMHSYDLAKIIKEMIDRNDYPSLNIAPGPGLSIDTMARIALRVTGNGAMSINYDTSKPNGQHIKDISNEELLKFMGGYEFIDLKDGIKSLYDHIMSLSNDS